MKKFLIIFAIFIANIAMATTKSDAAFNVTNDFPCYQKIDIAVTNSDTTFYVTSDFPSYQKIDICVNRYDHATVYAMEGCSSPFWSIGGVTHTENPIELDSHAASYYAITFYCGSYVIGFDVEFIEPNVPNETTDETWIHGGELAELQAVGNDSVDMYSYLWNTGETESTIYKPAGTYIAGISDMCATAYRTKIVKESVEIDLATCDLESNLNMVTWPTTEAQA